MQCGNAWCAVCHPELLTPAQNPDPEYPWLERPTRTLAYRLFQNISARPLTDYPQWDRVGTDEEQGKEAEA